MRTLIALCLLASAFSLDASKFAVLLQAGTRQNDAVESVYNLLRDLKTENANAQVAADLKNNTDEEILATVIGDLTNVATMNKQNYDNLGAVRASVEGEIRDNYAWISWAEGRLAEIDRRSESLGELRCYANALFVKSLADHEDAVNVVKLLQQDVAGYLTGGASELIETSNISDKLARYSHLFQQDAIAQFKALTQIKASERPGAVGDQVFAILGDLEAELTSTLAELQEQEIASAFALAKWVSDSGAEVAYLHSELERRNTQVEKQNTQLPAVLAQQGKALSMWKNSLNAVAGATQDLEEKREEYAEGVARRNEENAIIDQVIQLFKDQVRNLASGTSLKK